MKIFKYIYMAAVLLAVPSALPANVWAQESDAAAEEQTSAAQQEKKLRIYPLTADRIVEYVRKIEGRKALYLYRSGCQPCHDIMPQVMGMVAQGDGRLIPVSVDQYKSNLYRYLSKYNRVPFPGIILEPGDNEIEFRYNIEKELKIPKRVGEPHFILFDESGWPEKSDSFHPDDVAVYLYPERFEEMGYDLD